ncbi:membrane protein [Clostridium polyendosporum]|uniref:Diadenylate cyclase n=1 Tax=Clostridium polyendosporum TaxID=69208 RepID=A0A919VMV2_9CLOT|nr:diadenylate cyclase CdaA [Clostridium polyendosporum]GIM29943.1 membrane protein [Clostridium polyendosporum]
MQEFFRMIINTVKNISIWSVLDILVVSYIFFKGYMLIKETRAEQLLKGIILILVLIPISYLLRLDMLYFILSKTITIGVLTIIIIFQPEIRRALEHIGRTAFEDIHIIQDDETLDRVVTEIVTAVDNMSYLKTGALIAIEQSTGLGEITSNGTELDAKVSSGLLENIFVENTPLHDGATIIRNDRISAAGCVLPLTSNNNINKKLGTRHRAAIGLSENSDAIIIVVSEETGTVSLAVNGRLTRNYDRDKLKNILLKIMINRRSKRVKTIGERVKAWIAKLKIKK